MQRGVIRPRTGLLFIVLLTICAAAIFWWIYDPIDRTYGNFDGRVTATWADDGRNMTLERDFAFIDKSGKRWNAPTGSVINGASIPRIFWSVIGGPFEGKFRNAAVVHDAVCGAQAESWQEAHRMFYDAMRCSRVGHGKAQTMYWAVYQFGPRWERVPINRDEDSDDAPKFETIAVRVAQPEPDIVPKAERYFNKKDFTPEQIENCTVEDIKLQVAEWDAANEAQ
jgi:hypothetical protein